MIHCVIFDLDGTLLNTLEDLCDSVNYALAKHSMPELTLEEVRNYIGNGVRVLMTRAVPEGENNPKFEECLSAFKEYYKQNMYNKTAPYEGVMELLKELRLKGIQVGVVSNKFDLAVKTLCKKYFGDFVQIAIGENEAEGIRKKPAPDSLFKAICDLKANIETVVYVGDSETDIQTARNAEIDCIACTWGFRDLELLEEEGARLFAQKPLDILKIIEAL